jgi:molybdenum cofactor cytidylyltransferase
LPRFNVRIKVHIAAIILAAGESKRMGRDKALLPWPLPGTAASQVGHNHILLEAIVANARTIASTIVVVAGANYDVISAATGSLSVKVVRNLQAERGMFTSLQCGVSAALDAGAEAAIIFHVDRPPAAPSTLARLLQTFVNVNGDHVSVVPSYHGSHGHPYLVSAGMLHKFLSAPSTDNARDVMHELGNVMYVDCDDTSVVLNMNTQEDYERVAGAVEPKIMENHDVLRENS